MFHCLEGGHSVPGLKLEQLPQQVDGLRIEPRGVDGEFLGPVEREAHLGELVVL